MKGRLNQGPHMRRVWELLVTAFIGALVLLNMAHAGEAGQTLRAGGLEIFYGVIPAEILLGHPDSHEERQMHGGVPRGRGQHHLIVSVFDAKTKKRIANATVTARVGEIGLAVQGKSLEPMQFGGTATYGNYFSMAAPGPYRIELEIRPPGDARPIKATFEYAHPRR